jgi:hypothetical protein
MRDKGIVRAIAAVSIGLLIQVAVFASQIEIQGKDKPKNIHRIIHLSPPTPVENGPNGIAKISAKLKGAKSTQTFQVVGANLKAGTTYDLFVDGVKIASKAAAVDADEKSDDDGAAVEFFFSTKAHGPGDEDDEDGQRPLPDSLQPVTNIKKVELKDSTGKVVLTGEFSS